MKSICDHDTHSSADNSVLLPRSPILRRARVGPVAETSHYLVMFLSQHFEATINLNLGHMGLGLLAGGGRASSELHFDHLGIPRHLHMINVLLQLHIIDSQDVGSWICERPSPTLFT